MPAPLASIRLLAPLAHRDFRRLWLGTVVSNTGDWMDTVALGWLVLALAGSPVALGWLALARGVPILLFTLLGGAVADRVDRRRLLLVTQTVAMALAALLGLLALGAPPLATVLAIAAARGAVMSFNIPARQALVPALVPREAIAAAVALNSATFNLTRAVGPAAGGLLVAWAGPGWAFLANAATYAPVIWALVAMETPPGAARGDAAGDRTNLAADIVEGLRHVARTPPLRAPLVLVLLPMVLGQPYITLLAVVARDVLAAGPSGYGFLVAASALGSIAGAVWVGTLPAGGPKGQRQVRATVLNGAALALFAGSRAYTLSLALVVLVGATSTAAIALAVTRLQEAAVEAMRGRVMSLFFLNRGLVPLGTLLGGAGAAWLGAQAALALMGAAMAALALPLRAAADRVVHGERGGEDEHRGGEHGDLREVGVDDGLQEAAEERPAGPGLAGPHPEPVLQVRQGADPAEGRDGDGIGEGRQVEPAQPRAAPGDQRAQDHEGDEAEVDGHDQVGEQRGAVHRP